MALTLPPPAPNRGDPANFPSEADAFLTWWVDTFVREMNSLAVLGDGGTYFVQTSPTDATAGRLLANGAFGLGADAPTVVSNIDDQAIRPGFYSVNNTTTGTFPGGLAAAFAFLIVGRIDGTAVSQRMLKTGDGTEWVRHSASGSWTGWRRVIASDLFGFLPGYGDGTSVTQATSKSTSVTINKQCGRIVTTADSLAAGGRVGFQANNSFVTTADTIVINYMMAGADYNVTAKKNTTDGAFFVVIENKTGGALSQAITIDFTVIQSVVS